MATSLRLDLLKYDTSRYICGCLVAIPFQEAVDALALYAAPPLEGGEPTLAVATALYRVQFVSYVCRVQLHTLEDDVDFCCLSLDFQLGDESVSASTERWRVSLRAVSEGLSSLMSSRETKERGAQSFASWEGEAPSLRSLTLPADWPASVRISGAKLVAPVGDAYAIVQEFQDKEHGTVAIANTSVKGGTGLAPSQIRKGLRIVVRLAAAFRNGDWSSVAQRVDEYECS